MENVTFEHDLQTMTVKEAIIISTIRNIFVNVVWQCVRCAMHTYSVMGIFVRCAVYTDKYSIETKHADCNIQTLTYNFSI